MLLERSSKAGGCVGYARGRRPLSIHQALAANVPTSTQTPDQAVLPIKLAAAPPIDRGPVPPSYRTLTTAPTFSPVVISDHQYAPGPPQLLSRHLTLNPLHSVAAWAGARAAQLDLAFAASMDRSPVFHLAAAAATAVLTYLDLHPLSLLRSGLPIAVADWMEARLGDWVLPLASTAALVAGVIAALWQLRNWVATQTALIRFDAVVRSAVEARAGTTSSVNTVASAAEAFPASSSDPALAAVASDAIAATTSPSSSSSVSGSFRSLLPSSLQAFFEADWKSTDKTWLLLIMAGRLSTLLMAASSLMYDTSTVTVAAFTALCFGVSLAPLALPHIRHLIAASAQTPLAVPGGATSLATAAVLADAAFLAALAPAAPPLVRAVAMVAMAAGSGVAAVAAAASSRLAASQAAPGDVATFHVVVRLPTSGTLIDTTWGHRPLTAVVASDASLGNLTATPLLPEEERDPQARFRPLQTLLAATELQGMYLGERRTVVLATAGVAGDGDGSTLLPFRNPGLVWWQPMDDLQRKVGSGERALRAGDVFWYPVGSMVVELGSRRLSTAAVAAVGVGAGRSGVAALPGADSWGPVEVCAVSEGWVHLDANAGLKGGQAEVEVQLVALEKKSKG